MVQRIKRVKPQELNEGYNKILHWFFAYPTQAVSLSDIPKLVKVSKTTAYNIIEQLAREEFLKIEKLGKLWRISCNQSHPYNMTRKIPFHLQQLYESGIIDHILKAIPNTRTIILFGSYRKGDDTEKSDVDIAVETLDNEDVKIIPLGVFDQLGYREKVLVNVHKFSRNKIDLNLFANIANGIVMYGFLEVRP